MPAKPVSESYPFNEGGGEEPIWLTAKALEAIGKILQESWPLPDKDQFDIRASKSGVAFQLHPSAIASVQRRPWDLSEVPQTGGAPSKWKVEVGQILDGSGKAGSYMTCTNPDDSFTLAADGQIAVEFADEEPVDFSMRYYDTWPITGDYVVELDESENFVRSLVPLYHIRSAEVYGAQKVGELWAEPVSFRLVDSYFQHADKPRILAPDIAR